MNRKNRVRPPRVNPNPGNPDIPRLPAPSSSIYSTRSEIDPSDLWPPLSRSEIHSQVWESLQGLAPHVLRLLVPSASPRPLPPDAPPSRFTSAPSPLSFRCPNSVPTHPSPSPPRFPPYSPPPPPLYPAPPTPPPPSSPPPPMGGNSRYRSVRSGRKARYAAKHQPSSSNPPATTPFRYPSPSLVPADGDPTIGHPTPNQNPNLSDAYDDNGWGYFTEEELEVLLLKNLDLVYREAINKLVTLGYDEEVAFRAVLCSGHCYGSMDVLSNNIVQNALAHLNSPMMDGEYDVGSDIPTRAFTSLRRLQEYSLAGMVCLLQQIRPHLSRGDAMWCLLMSDLHVGHASTIDIGPLPPSATPYPAPTLAPVPDSTASCGVADGANCAPPPVGLCKFHATVGSGGSTDVPLAMRRNANSSELPPSVGFLPCQKSPTQPRVEVGLGSLSLVQPPGDASATSIRAGDDAQEDLVDSMLKALEAMNLEEEGKSPDGVVDHQKEMILDLVRQIRELEVQVKDQREWAQKTALQAARKISNDMIELRTLRMEREENQRMEKGKQPLDDATMKRLTEMENALKKASGQVDLVDAIVWRLETENAEIRAEIEASKLSASESMRTCLELGRREKKCLKKMLAREKRKEKFQLEIVEEKRKIAETEQKLAEVRAASKDMEAKWKREIKLREQATVQADEARRAREAAEINAKRRQEALRQKTEVNLQRRNDDIKRLEEELSHLQGAAASTQLNIPFLNILNPGDVDAAKAHTGFNKPQDSPKLNHDRVCVICLKDEVSVLFLPCAHQVVCVNCNEDHEKKGKGSCPCCDAKIDERICVYGVSS